MHYALLIDEIIQEIFELCYDDKWTLAQLARCCHAWKVPALEKNWRKLPSINPFIRLASPLGCAELDNLYEYARKVKHIQFRTNPPDFPTLDACLGIHPARSHFFPNLSSVEISGDGCATPAIDLSLTPALRSVNINIGRKAGVARSHYIANYLLVAISACYALETVHIRGFACERLNASIVKLSTLRTLSLKVGNSLVADTLVAIAFFPVLEELTVHADRVDPEEFKGAIALKQAPVFPSLRALKIRAGLVLVETVLEGLRSITFNDLDMEVIDTQDSSAWTHLFSTMHTHPTLPNTLERLKIDYHIELDSDIEVTPTSFRNGDKASNIRFTLNTISPLSKIPNLRRLTVDANHPPDVDDKDIDEIARWWPHLDCLDFGILPDNNDEGGEVKWKPRTTLTCLGSFAQRCKKLRRLVLPVDVTLDFIPGSPSTISQHSLRELVITSSDTQMPDSYVCALFPSLKSV